MTATANKIMYNQEKDIVVFRVDGILKKEDLKELEENLKERLGVDVLVLNAGLKLEGVLRKV